MLSPTTSTSSSSRRKRRNLLVRCERCCCNIITYFPLLLVFGLTTWAIWAQVQISYLPHRPLPRFTAALGILLYSMLNWSYLTAVFTDPGSPAKHAGISDDLEFSSVTVKSTGGVRYCKKCQAKKPDRAHHCSTCRRCVLKMDHHCPWLATCVGLRNYKAFVLFLIYTSLFCWLCFYVSATWLWAEVTHESTTAKLMMPVNFVVLSVVSGVVGLVITGFTAYHLYLASKNRTTIESLESTRYLSPVKSHLSHQLSRPRSYADPENHSFGEQLRDLGSTLTQIHANALPGVLRPEEGEERVSPAQNSLRRYESSYTSQHRELDRYNDYLDERDSQHLPNAFDLGWKRNLIVVMGSNPFLWLVPIINSTGDGWHWEQNHEWQRLREQLRQAREIEMQNHMHTHYWHANDVPNRNDPASPLSKADRVLGRKPGEFFDGAGQLQRSRSRQEPVANLMEDSSEDEEQDDFHDMIGRTRLLDKHSLIKSSKVSDCWNDLPDDMLEHRSRRKGR